MKGAREPSMEDILASIKKVIAEEKEIRAAAIAPESDEDDVLELDQPLGNDEPSPATATAAAPVDLGPPLASDQAVGTSRERLAALHEAAANAPPRPVVNPFEEMVRDMVRPLLKEWLDSHLSDIVDDHVRREIGRITGTTL